VLSTLTAILIAAAATALCAFWVLAVYRVSGGRRALASLGAAVATILVGAGLYVATGSPGMADAPYAARLEALKQRDPTTYSADEALAILSEAARANPRDPLPLYYSGEVLLQQDRPREAARAYDAALRRAPNMADAMIGLGRALVRLENGQVTPDALRLFTRASETSADPTPWIYRAMDAMQRNDTAQTRDYWGQAYARMRYDDPRREMALRMSRGEAVQQE